MLWFSVRITRLGISCRRSVVLFALNCLLPIQRFIAMSYADRHNTASLNCSKTSGQLAECPSLRVSNEHCFIVRVPRAVEDGSPFFSFFSPLTEGGRWLWCSSLRPSRAHRVTVRTLGAGGAPSRRTITTSSAHPSTPSPPSLCAAHRPWLVRAPSRR